MCEVSSFSKCSLALVSVFLITTVLVGVKLCVSVVLICSFLMTSEVKHLFMYLLVICKSYLVNGNIYVNLLLALILMSQVSQSPYPGWFTAYIQAINLLQEAAFYLCAIYFLAYQGSGQFVLKLVYTNGT